MKVLLVNGSPHKNGCVNRALEEVRAQLEREQVDAEIFWIGTKVQGCIACYRCHELGHCVFTGDSVEDFIGRAREADGFVFGTPVYYAGPCGNICSFMERAFFSAGQVLRGKPAATVVSCRRGGSTETFARLNMFYMMSNMPVVTSQYWNQVHGNSPEEVEQDLEGLQTMRTLGTNMALMLKAMESAKKSGITSLVPAEEHIFTNFIR